MPKSDRELVHDAAIETIRCGYLYEYREDGETVRRDLTEEEREMFNNLILRLMRRNLRKAADA
jgi:hypothetical protein